MSSHDIKVGVVIPIHNRRETTLQCLRSLARIDRTGIDVKICIVDDGSTDGSSEAIEREFSDVHLVQGDGTLHYAAGTNRGISTAMEWNADFIVAMNDDAVFHPQFLQRLVATATANPHSVVGALLLLWDQPHKVFQVGLSWNMWKGGWQIPEDLTAFTVPDEPFEVECLVGNCLIYPREAIVECGLMDEKHFPHGWGDAQHTTGMSKAGWRLLVDPKALVWCEPNTNPKPLHSQPVISQLRILFANQRHPANLKRQFIARWYSAPTRLKAVTAFAVYCFLLGVRTLQYTTTNERH